MEYIVNDGGMRLDVFLADVMAGVSRARVQKVIADGGVSVNGNAIIKKNAVLAIGDTIVIDDISTQPRESLPVAQDIPLDILYEDEFLAVINKPAGLVVHPGNGKADGTVVNALLHRFGSRVSNGSGAGRPGIVHRLDKDTSGALMVAKTDATHAALAELFSSREIKKVYTGFCAGIRPMEHEIIDLPLARSRRDPIKRAVDSQRGSPAVTEYSLKKFHCGISLMEFILHTGRTHQIRVHCAHRGFPIVGDGLYGGTSDKVQKIPPMERPFAHSIFKCFTRQALHALSLNFSHPFTKDNINITAPYPDDFCRALSIVIPLEN